MKWLLLAIVMVGCKTMQPPVYTNKTDAQYVGYQKDGNQYVMKFWARRYDTLYVTQQIKPLFKYRGYYTLAWNCDTSNHISCTHDIKIFKSR